MNVVDRDAPLQFLATAYDMEDWLAVLLKFCSSGRTVQRIGPVSQLRHPRFQAWLRYQNATGADVYVSANALEPQTRHRRRDSVAAVRHVFLDADRSGAAVLGRIGRRPDLPPPSYVVHSSPGRLHVLWRVTDFTCDAVEALQRQLARELHTDRAATSCAQLTRLPGFRNYKYDTRPLVRVAYGRVTQHPYSPDDFPSLAVDVRAHTCPSMGSARPRPSALDRARRYVAAVPPAIAGQHGDLRTFRLCCRLVRGFLLSDQEALSVLAEWNARCVPPWPERDLIVKLRSARRNGREAFGSLLEATR